MIVVELAKVEREVPIFLSRISSLAWWFLGRVVGWRFLPIPPAGGI